MAIHPPFNPDETVTCPRCHWTGRAGNAICPPKELVRCPRCNHQVHWQAKPIHAPTYQTTEMRPLR